MLYEYRIEWEKIKSVTCQKKWEYIDDVVISTEKKEIFCQCKIDMDTTPDFIETLFQPFYKQYISEKENPPEKKTEYEIISENKHSEIKHLIKIVKQTDNIKDFIWHLEKCEKNDEYSLYNLYIKIQLAVFNIGKSKETKTPYKEYSKKIDKVVCDDIYHMLKKSTIKNSIDDEETIRFLAHQWINKNNAEIIVALVHYKTKERQIGIPVTKEKISRYLDSIWINRKIPVSFGEVDSVKI